MFEELFYNLYGDENDENDGDYEPSEGEESESDNGTDIRIHIEEPVEQELSDTIRRQHQHTDYLRSLCWPTTEDASIVQSVEEILDLLAARNMNVALFLDALTWGNGGCTRSYKISRARSVLMHSKELPGILERWYRPPRKDNSTNTRPAGATDAIRSVSQLCISDDIKLEFAALGNITWVKSENSKFREKDITTMYIKKLIEDMKKAAPMLWSLLESMARSSNQEKRNKKKDPQKIMMVVLSMLLYSRNQHCNRLQKIMAIYFKCRHLAIRGFDVLHRLGVTMSSTWAQNTLKAIAKDNMDTAATYIESLLVMLTYDNVNIKKIAYEQRINNQTQFDNGAAATAIVKRYLSPLTPDQVVRIKAVRAQGILNPIDCNFVFRIEESANQALHRHIRHAILRVALESPDFDLTTYEHKDSELLLLPDAIRALAIGLNNIAIQFLLRTVKMEETSYEGNRNVLKEMFRQLKLDSPEVQAKLGTEKIIPIVGDQLTADRLRGLFKFRAEDHSSFERMEHILFTFGWFHLEMIHATSLHKQYYGKSGSRGLADDFALLKKKGVRRTITKGPFFHHLDEAIHHRLEAHLRYAWLVAADVKNLSELRQQSPQQLLDLAEKIYLEYASNIALDEFAVEEEQDDLQSQSVKWNRDALHYVTLRKAVKEGDVGIMEAMIPHLLFRFVGGNNKKYTGEMFELLQMLHRELPPDVADFVREHCWLVNFQGKRDTHLPLDMAQEHNIKAIRGIDGGPHGGWPYLYEMTPATRTMAAVNKHVEIEFNAAARGAKHSSPSKEEDVKKLLQSYQDSEIYENKGRKIKKKAAKDLLLQGSLLLQKGSHIKNWNMKRAFPRSTVELPFEVDPSQGA